MEVKVAYLHGCGSLLSKSFLEELQKLAALLGLTHQAFILPGITEAVQTLQNLCSQDTHSNLLQSSDYNDLLPHLSILVDCFQNYAVMFI